MNKLGSNFFKKIKEEHLDVPIAKLKEELVLPEQFCHTCTLKEGTVIVVTILQVVAALFVAFILTMLIVYPEQSDKWWEQKFKDDYDPYINGEYKDEIIDVYYPLWLPLSYTLVALHSLYFFTGILVYYALCVRNAHPAWYLPWLIMTFLLVFANYVTVLTMVVVTFIISTFRDITVTWDMVPTILVFLYALAWSYAFVVVLAQYKRRVIVRWWYNYERRKGKGKE